MNITQTIKHLDWLLIAAVFLLSGLGLLTVYSAGNSGSAFFEKQLIWLSIGFFVMLAVSFFDYRIFKNYSSSVLGIYLFAVVLLLFLFIFGSNIRGSLAWFRFGGVAFEPVELVKLVLIITLAKYFSARHTEIYRWHHFIVSGIYVSLPLLLVLVQPDFGSAAILFFIWLGLLAIAGLKAKHFLVLVSLLLVVSFFGWSYVLHNYQRERLSSFLSPQSDPLGAGYNILQSTIAVGSGGWLGKGLGRGTQSQLNFLPEQHTDFIFAAIAEEWGFFGVLFLISLLAFIFWRLAKSALSASNNFSKFFISGFMILILTHGFVNIGMNLGILPITGISLPFVSYGGSNLLMNFLAIGLIQSIRVRQIEFEKDEE